MADPAAASCDRPICGAVLEASAGQLSRLVNADVEQQARRSAMEFVSQGAMFLLDIPSIGEEWGVQIPWDVAAEYAAMDSLASPSDDELREWLQDAEPRFARMISARADPDSFPDAEQDDPRILAAQELRHI